MDSLVLWIKENEKRERTERRQRINREVLGEKKLCSISWIRASLTREENHVLRRKRRERKILFSYKNLTQNPTTTQNDLTQTRKIHGLWREKNLSLFQTFISSDLREDAFGKMKKGFGEKETEYGNDENLRMRESYSHTLNLRNGEYRHTECIQNEKREKNTPSSKGHRHRKR